eukprot:1442825-Alexandrium_andersonii.AAC.1
MSASLVGSEMCIRDRGSEALLTLFGDLAELAISRVSLPPGLPPRSSRPVSYTHLTLPTICSV